MCVAEKYVLRMYQFLFPLSLSSLSLDMEC